MYRAHEATPATWDFFKVPSKIPSALTSKGRLDVSLSLSISIKARWHSKGTCSRARPCKFIAHAKARPCIKASKALATLRWLAGCDCLVGFCGPLVCSIRKPSTLARCNRICSAVSALQTHAAPQPGRSDRPDPKPGRSTHHKRRWLEEATRSLSCIAASRLILQYCE